MVAADATPAKLADILGVTRTTVLRWLTGEHAPHLAMRAAIARAFAIEPDDLLEER
jgi:transcriptional regulator with XRE-family HTH domain